MRITGRRIRTATVVALVLTCLASVGGYILADRDPDVQGVRRATPGPWIAAADAPRGALVGDLDGDGVPDRAALTSDHRLVVRLATRPSRPVSLELGMDARLVGLAYVGTAGLGVVASDVPVSDLFTRVWCVIRLHGRHLARIPTRGPLPLGIAPGSLTSWIAAGRLYDGRLDDLQQGQRHRVVVASRWAVHGGQLTARPVGLRCWDTATDRPPAPCPVGADWAYDAGPPGGLPKLRPLDPLPGTVGIGGTVTHGRYTWSLVRAVPPGSDDAPNVDLALRVRGRSQRLRLPWGPAPSLHRARVDLGAGASGAVLVDQGGGDFDGLQLYLPVDGGPTLVRTHGPVSLGDGFTEHRPQATYLTWRARDGSLYTRVGTATPGRYRLYGWHLVGGGPTSRPVLAATSLGPVCIDLTLHTYGTCAG